jgi:hypothetical protein
MKIICRFGPGRGAGSGCERVCFHPFAISWAFQTLSASYAAVALRFIREWNGANRMDIGWTSESVNASIQRSHPSTPADYL